jgi:hypothetical protein
MNPSRRPWLSPGRGTSLALGASLALALGAAVGCSVAPSAAGTDGGIFLAFDTTFNGFHSWPSAVAMPSPNLPPVDAGGVGPDGGATDGGVHPPPETEYWQLPPITPGSTTFPLGTIIVKETNEADPTARQVFAMVKRGGDFNANGAINWEFFELTNNANGTEKVNWQGYGPLDPTKDIYGGNPNVCNDCHGKAVSNDYVWSAALQLSALESAP